MQMSAKPAISKVSEQIMQTDSRDIHQRIAKHLQKREENLKKIERDMLEADEDEQIIRNKLEKEQQMKKLNLNKFEMKY